MFIILPATNSLPRVILNTIQIVEINEVIGPAEFRVEIYYTNADQVKLRTYVYENAKSLAQALLDMSYHLGASQVPCGKYTNKPSQY